jgi:hypothetical protein
MAREIDKVQSSVQFVEEAILYLQTAVWRDELISKRRVSPDTHILPACMCIDLLRIQTLRFGRTGRREGWGHAEITILITFIQRRGDY